MASEETLSTRLIQKKWNSLSMSPGSSGKRNFRPRSSGGTESSGPSARWLAFLAIQSFIQRGLFVSKSLDDLFVQFPTLPRDRHFATELASETIRRGITIDTILARYVSRPRENVEDELWLLLQLGCCQLLFLPHIPPHAAVNETVALCDRLQKSRAKGFINGTLRNLEREISLLGPVAGEDGANESLSLKSLNSHLLPIFEFHGSHLGWRTVELPREVFSNPANRPLDYLAEVTSLPVWLMERWGTEVSDLQKLLARGMWFTTPGRVSLRVNLNRATREEVLQKLQEAEVDAEPGALPESIVLRGTLSPGEIPIFHDGAFSVQDESAMRATELLNPQPGERILDLCAAPGGKSCHLAERLNGTGQVVACDLSETRLRPIRENIERLQLKNITVQRVSGEGPDSPAGPFDAVLLDVPCSNTGVLGKRPEARWRITPSTFLDLIPLQRRLLEDAVQRIRPGGRILYSTCSIDAAENSEVVQSFLNAHPEMRLVSQQTHEPGNPCDGGYQALLVSQEG